MKKSKMTSTRPYLIRAFYDWIVNNQCTPHIVVNASYPEAVVPREYVDNGQIVLNVSVSAVQGLLLGDNAIEFQARFGAKIFKVYAPVGAVLAIYAKENGRGMVFAEEEHSDEPPFPVKEESPDAGQEKTTGGGGKAGKGKGKGRPSHLTVVK